MSISFLRIRITPKGRKAKFKLRIPPAFGKIVNSTNIGGKNYDAEGNEMKSTNAENKQKFLFKIVH